jgi:nitrite reductase (NADH) small subunit
MGKHRVCTTEELQPGAKKVLTLEGRSIGVFNIKGTYYAIRNRCPHQGAELCKGSVAGIMLPSEPGKYQYGRDGEIVRCPWHGWEFDITTGKSVFDPFSCLVKTYAVDVIDPSTESREAFPEVESYPVEVENTVIVITIG